MSAKILSEIDATLEQLIRNAEALQEAEWADLSETEIEAFQKTQESLLHHWMDLDRNFACRHPALEKKQRRFKKIKMAVDQAIGQTAKKRSVLSKRRAKRFFL